MLGERRAQPVAPRPVHRPHAANVAVVVAVFDQPHQGELVEDVAFVEGGVPYCIPMLYARDGDSIYIHGSSASGSLRTLAHNARACLTLTLVRGLVLACSAFEHSANYESVVALGSFERIDDEVERRAAFRTFTNKLLRGRWDEVREPNRKELKATAILAMTIEEVSLKARSGPPTDDDSPDAAINTWAGVVPVVVSYGEPVPSLGLRPGLQLAASVRRLLPPCT